MMPFKHTDDWIKKSANNFIISIPGVSLVNIYRCHKNTVKEKFCLISRDSFYMKKVVFYQNVLRKIKFSGKVLFQFSKVENLFYWSGFQPYFWHVRNGNKTRPLGHIAYLTCNAALNFFHLYLKYSSKYA